LLDPEPCHIDSETVRLRCGVAATICSTVEDYQVLELLTDNHFVFQSVEANEGLLVLGRA
jgi:hypothetical protein